MDLNQYIKDTAGRTPQPDAVQAFRDAEIFFSLPLSVDSVHDELPQAAILDTAGFELGLDVARLPQGQLGLFYASKDDPRLAKSHGGIVLIRAAEMICRDMPALAGMLIQSDTDAWLAFPRETLRAAVESGLSGDKT